MADVLSSIPPSYLYNQFADDKDIKAMVSAYNEQAQKCLNWFNQMCLGNYIPSSVSGSYLDWIAAGVYGMYRVTLYIEYSVSKGPLNTLALNSSVLNASLTDKTGTARPMTDDVFKRCMTWNIFKADGMQFSARWLKRRVKRFLTGLNGAPALFSDTNDVSVTFPSAAEVIINVPPSYGDMAVFLSLCLGSGILMFPIDLTVVVEFSGGGSSPLDSFVLDQDTVS